MAITEISCRLQGRGRKVENKPNHSQYNVVFIFFLIRVHLYKIITPCFVGLISNLYNMVKLHHMLLILSIIRWCLCHVHAADVYFWVDASGVGGFLSKKNKSKNSLRCDTTYCRRHIALCTKRISYISTRSTLIPQGSVASSRTVWKIKLTQENCSPSIKSILVISNKKIPNNSSWHSTTN